LRSNERRDRLEDIRQIADAFREPVEAPDLASAILARVDSQRCFLSRRARWMVWAGRAAVALTVALVVLGFTLANRYTPGTLQVVAQPMPVTDVISAVSTQANQQLTALRFSLEPSRGAGMEITSILATVAPGSDLAQPIGAALQAVRFVGPPEVASADDLHLVYTDGAPISELRASRLPRMSESAWAGQVVRDAMEDRRWLEDESPLLSGTGFGSHIAPK
jgi:hypothetical protein